MVLSLFLIVSLSVRLSAFWAVCLLLSAVVSCLHFGISDWFIFNFTMLILRYVYYQKPIDTNWNVMLQSCQILLEIFVRKRSLASSLKATLIGNLGNSLQRLTFLFRSHRQFIFRLLTESISIFRYFPDCPGDNRGPNYLLIPVRYLQSR